MTRGERLACCAGLAVLVLCALTAGLLASRDPPPDPDPGPWNVTREMWLARNITGRVEEPVPWNATFLPLRLVIVQHTVGSECKRLAKCAAVMRNMLDSYLQDQKYDLPYNFVIGNDARVYEGRGWALMGAHTRTYNYCALGVAFTGNYANSTTGTVPTEAQMKSFRDLLAVGVADGWIHPRHVVLGARDVQGTKSPGDLLYAKLRSLPEAPANPTRFSHHSCVQIYKFKDFDDVESRSTVSDVLSNVTPPDKPPDTSPPVPPVT